MGRRCRDPGEKRSRLLKKEGRAILVTVRGRVPTSWLPREKSCKERPVKRGAATSTIAEGKNTLLIEGKNGRKFRDGKGQITLRLSGIVLANIWSLSRWLGKEEYSTILFDK